jgi:5-methylcytosine-specific restriction endonuclease McrA
MPKRTGRPWQRVKRRIIRRDGGMCHLCNQPGADTADHLVPVSLGGALYDAGNLKAAHQTCNRIRGNRPIEVAKVAIARQLSGQSTTNEVGEWSW